jgi:predicted transcriptional regulator
MKLFEVKNILAAEVLVGEEQLDRDIVGGGSADLMEDILSSAAKDAVMLTGVVDEQVIRTAKVAGVGAVVIVRGKTPSQRLINLARDNEMPLLVTDKSLFSASGRLYMNGMRGLDGSW